MPYANILQHRYPTSVFSLIPFDSFSLSNLTHGVAATVIRTKKEDIPLERGLLTRRRRLTRILNCSGCGRKMRAIPYGSRPQVRRGYRCTSNESGKVSCPKPQVIVPADLIEGQFGELIKGFRLPADWRERVTQLVQENAMQAVNSEDRERLSQKLERDRRAPNG